MEGVCNLVDPADKDPSETQKKKRKEKATSLFLVDQTDTVPSLLVRSTHMKSPIFFTWPFLL